MLLEIYCEKFHQPKIIFNEGLSVILGTNEAHNSIGKSTFLLIIDFVFGGNTYAKQDNIIRNVGSHDIFFSFKFNNNLYRFCRNNTDIKTVWKCNDKYEKLEPMYIDTYCRWLNEHYQLELPELTFRNAVGRYIRVYGKDNYNEKHPLQSFSAEKTQESILALIKLFNFYLPIENAEKQSKLAKEAYNSFTKAQKLKFIAKINKSTFNKNSKEIEQIAKEIEKLSCGFFDLDSAVSEKALEIKNKLSKIRRIKGKVKARYDTLTENAEYKFAITNDSLNNLKVYFPNANFEHIAEVENFHKKISIIFKSELNNERANLQEELADYEKIIDDLERELQTLTKTPNLSKLVLSKHTELLKSQERLQQENDSYTKMNELYKAKKNIEEQLKLIKEKQLAIIATEINNKMQNYNNLIYKTEHKPPIISFTKDNYNFFTPDDTGTGIAYKGLVIFDLAILDLTKLPLLVHDSLVLKQISNGAIDKIIELYSLSGKQVIIAFDKQNSYSQKTYNLLNSSAVLKLGINGKQLFGKSWA